MLAGVGEGQAYDIDNSLQFLLIDGYP